MRTPISTLRTFIVFILLMTSYFKGGRGATCLKGTCSESLSDGKSTSLKKRTISPYFLSQPSLVFGKLSSPHWLVFRQSKFFLPAFSVYLKWGACASEAPSRAYHEFPMQNVPFILDGSTEKEKPPLCWPPEVSSKAQWGWGFWGTAWETVCSSRGRGRGFGKKWKEQRRRKKQTQL